MAAAGKDEAGAAAAAAHQRQDKLQQMYGAWRSKFAEVPDMTPRELQAALQQQYGEAAAPAGSSSGDGGTAGGGDDAAGSSNVAKRLVLVDVRMHDEQQVSVLPGNNTLPRQEFEARAAEFREHRVVCYCTAGYRSGLYAKQLRERGFDAHNLAGSILAWTQEGLPLVELSDRSKQTTRVHVFSKAWSLQGEGYEPVAFKRPYMRVAGDFLAGMFGRNRGAK